MSPLYAPGDPIRGRPGQSLNEPMIFMDPTVCSMPPWPDPATPNDVESHYALNYFYDYEQPSRSRRSRKRR